jgi:two-component system, OmpR family, sensor histidine kinase BaeS
MTGTASSGGPHGEPAERPGEPGERPGGRSGPPWRNGPPWSGGRPPWGGGRPPWWPEGEPFPPRGPGGWRGVRRHFARRAGLAFAVFFGLLFLTSALAVAVLSGVFGLGRHHGLVPLAGVLGLLLLIGLAFGARSLRGMARPLGDVMEAAERVAGGDYSVRVAERAPRDMRRLARSFNAMTERLATAERRRRDLLADVAHELRTPLAVIQGNVEGMLDGIYPADAQHLRPVLDTTQVMARLLEDLQTLSTAEAGALRLHRDRVAPADLVADAVAAYRSPAEEAGLDLREQVAGGLPDLDVDRVRVHEILANLLANAVRHTPAGGSVVVGAAATQGGTSVALTVTDTGTGIDAESLPAVFDRFVKGSASRGAGLGLAIARSLAEAHGGTLTAESEPGRGTTMRVTLPAA